MHKNIQVLSQKMGLEILSYFEIGYWELGGMVVETNNNNNNNNNNKDSEVSNSSLS